MLVVRGDAGVGKSALLQHLIASALGFRVVHATGVESEMELPFAALHQLCASMLDGLEVLPEPQRDAVSTAFGLTSGSSPDGLLIGLAVLNLLAATAEAGPLLCVIDDAQWLDRSSALCLSFVARRLLADEIAFVFATRSPTSELANFNDLVVDGLLESDAQTLLNSVLHVTIDERVRDRIVAETRGNPLALVEWPRGLTPEQLAGGFGMPASMPITGQIEESFRRRVGELPEEARRFLTLAAADPTGDPVLVWRAATLLGLDAGAAGPAIDAGLIEIGARVWFRHPLVRSAAYGATTLDDRREAHRALADATDGDAEADRRAWHRALGSPGPDEDIARALEQSAGRARARGGVAAAAALLDRAVALTIDPSRRTMRTLGAASAYLDAGAFDAAAGLLALAEATPVDDVAGAYLDGLRAQHASMSGDLRDAPEISLRAARRFESVGIDLALEMYVAAMDAAAITGNFNRGVKIEDIGRAALASPALTDPIGREWLVRGLAEFAVEGPAAAAPALRRALETDFRSLTPRAHAIHWCGHLTAAAAVLWDNDSMRQISEVYVAMTRELGALTMLPWALNALAGALIFDGDLDGGATALAEADEIIAVTGANTSWATAQLAAWRGNGGAMVIIDDVAASARAVGHALGLRTALWARACLRNGMGQYEHALAAGLDAAQLHWDWGAHSCYSELIEAAVRGGEPSVAAAQLERLAETVEPSGSHWAFGVYARSRALLRSGAAAEDDYNEAIDELARSEIRPELARAHLLYGEWLRRENRRVDARTQLRAAHEMLVGMGIHQFAERARQELLATGETVRKRSVGSFDELTPQEANIARLAAEGATNSDIGTQLFISPRTVEWHLRKVFSKVGVTSRRDLRDALGRHHVKASR